MTVQMMSEPMMPIGMSRFGFLHSSAHVETASKPMYAKKMIAAPVEMPAKPFGANGCQFAGLTNLKLTKTKNASTTSLIADHDGVEAGRLLDSPDEDDRDEARRSRTRGR